MVLSYRVFEDNPGNKHAKLGRDEWNPWDMVVVAKDGDHIAGSRTILRKSPLREGVLRVVVQPKPGNWNIEGACGATIAAEVTVSRAKRIIVKRAFESECLSDDPVTTEIVITGPSLEPQIKQVPRRSFD